MMATYRLVEKVLIGQIRHDAGAVVDFDGEPGMAFAPLDGAAVAAKAAAVSAWMGTNLPVAGIVPNTRMSPHMGQRHLAVARMARSLGFAGGTNAAAEAYIDAWLAAPAVVGTISAERSVSDPTNFTAPPGYVPWPA